MLNLTTSANISLQENCAGFSSGFWFKANQTRLEAIEASWWLSIPKRLQRILRSDWLGRIGQEETLRSTTSAEQERKRAKFYIHENATKKEETAW